jgi:uncharacterized protein (TIGR02452 family)
MNRNQLIQVFEDTKEYTDKKNYNTYSKKFCTSDIKKSNMSDLNEKKIFTINSDTVSAAYEYSKKGNTCILNMASWKKPGGGVANGAMAQEECIFRCSNLFETITSDFYPLKDDEAIYTEDAYFFKDKDYNYQEEFSVDVITIPALNLNKYPKDFNKTKEYTEIMSDKIRCMLNLPYDSGCENIILGAWGCGVYNNDPNDICKLFQNVLSDCDIVNNIVFAVINDHNSVGNNYEIFKKHFSN